MHDNFLSFHKKITTAGSLIVFEDIGTSPLYILNAVFHGKAMTEAMAMLVRKAMKAK